MGQNFNNTKEYTAKKKSYIPVPQPFTSPPHSQLILPVAFLLICYFYMLLEIFYVYISIYVDFFIYI